MRAQTMDAVLGALGDCGSSCWQAVFTGHSLGSTITTLAAVDFAASTQTRSQGPVQPVAANLFTFGSPRVSHTAPKDGVPLVSLGSVLANRPSIPLLPCTEVVTS